MIQIRRHIIIALLLLVCFGHIMVDTALSEEIDELEDVELSIQIPYGGQFSYQDGSWYEVTVTVSNYAQHSLLGKLKFLQQGSSHGREFSLIEHEVDIPVGESADYTFAIPWSALVEHAYLRLLSEDGSQKTINLDAYKEFNQAPTISVIAEDNNAFKFLQTIESEWLSYPYIRYMLVEDLPTQVWAIQESMIAIDGEVLKNLSKEQITALNKWLTAGGVLLLSGGKSILEHVDHFAELVPLTQMSVERINYSEEMAFAHHLPKGWPLQQIDILTGQRKEKAYTFPSLDFPLFIGEHRGNGLIIMSTYDIQDEALATWPGHSELWKRVLQQYGAFQSMRVKENQAQDIYSLTELSKQIPDVQAPSIILITAIWLIYLMIVAPGLYVLLKKTDKREWAWLIIPVLAIATALSVYFVGVKRIANESSTHVVSSIQIVDPELARVGSAASFLVLEGQDYEVKVHENMMVIPFDYRNQLQKTEAYLAYNKLGERYLSYNSVPYMSITNLSAYGFTPHVGFVEHDLYAEGDYLQGRITNRTMLALEEIELQIGYHTYSLGKLAVNETKEINLELAKHSYPDWSAYERNYHLTDIGTRLVMNKRMQAQNYPPAHLPTIQLYARSTDRLDILSVSKEETQDYFTNLVTQELVLQPRSDRRLTYPYGSISTNIGQLNEFSSYYSYGDNVLTSQGEIPFYFYVQPLGFEVQRIQLPVGEQAFAPFTIKLWNVLKEQWEEVDKSRDLELNQEQIATYVNSEGKLTILLVNISSEQLQVPFPHVLVEGERVE